MRDTDELTEMAEALPLSRVSPLWRIAAIFLGLVLIASLVILVPMLGALWIHNIQMKGGMVPVTMAVRSAPAVGVAATVAVPTAGMPPVAGADLPYPTQEDLRPHSAAAPTEAPARDRFLKLSQEMWKAPQGGSLEAVTVSSSGLQMAFVSAGDLWIGPLGAPQPRGNLNQVYGPLGGVVGRRPGIVYAPMASGAGGVPGQAPVDRPATWSADSGYICFEDPSGLMGRFDTQTMNLQRFPFRGSAPTQVVGNIQKIIFLRSRLKPKIETGDDRPMLDATEVVSGDLGTEQVEVLVPATTQAWIGVAASPDGKKLVLIADPASVTGSKAAAVFIKDEKEETPRPLPMPGPVAVPVAWTPDGKALVYARAPASSLANGEMDLYSWDLAGGKETRITRGGGFRSPSLGSDGNLFFLARQGSGSGATLALMRVPWKTAREFAAQNPEPMGRDSGTWTTVIDQAMKEAKVSADADGGQLTPDKLTALADVFALLYRRHFKAEPPMRAEDFEQQQRELKGLAWRSEVRPRLTLVLGAVEGEFLRKVSGAAWALSAGPLAPVSKADDEEQGDNLFGYVVNPFDQPWSNLDDIVKRAQGRPIILANDLAVGRAAAEKAKDADWDRAVALLKAGKGADGEALLLALVKRHGDNHQLAFAAAKLLYEHHRRPALRNLLRSQFAQAPADPRRYNLLGLALLRPRADEPLDPDADPTQAIDAFKNALRCDLNFGAGYLNLAEAYRQSENMDPAQQCLRRYLERMPNGPYARDARRRLADIDADMTTPR
jgi:hypothetical protein